jgi:molecular chaperone DnaJ
MCGGSGKIKGGKSLFGGGTCPQCNGTGASTEPCGICHGTGHVERQRKISDVRIPAGVRDGQRVRLAGQAGGADLYLKVKIHPDSKVRREGNDLFTDFPLHYTVASLGGEATVDTFEGRKLLAIPPSTQSGQKFRLTGLGMPNVKGGARGSLFAEARIIVDKALSNEERELLTKLAKIRKVQTT